MALDSYNRFVRRSFECALWAVIALTSLMWLAALADHLLHLGWGWDVQIIWLAPFLVAGALLTQLLGHAILGWMGARD